MVDYVRGFHQIDRTQVALVGGKGALLGELSSLDGIDVPPGFCVTTDAFRRIVAGAPSLDERLDQLTDLAEDDVAAIATVSADIRRTFEEIAVPDDVAAAITGAVARMGADGAYAVRSSATTEDLPSASFAGQYDTYLNVLGAVDVLAHVRLCWASLFTDRAATYRLRNGLDHRSIEMAVVVQQMVVPAAAGVLFTADPVTSNRKLVSVEATVGLGEALVSGRVSADVYKVGHGVVITRTVATKQWAVAAAPGGGTRDVAVEPGRQQDPVLTDAQVVALARLGRRIEAHVGCPQDIEWCLVDDGFVIVQSRPITTLFPIPEADDDENHVYLSVGHQQMMTDAMKPLGISFWQMTTPRPMAVAGGRLFVDVAATLATPSAAAALLDMVGSSDPLTGDALRTVIERGDFIPSRPDGDPRAVPTPRWAANDLPPIDTDPAIVNDLIGNSRASIASLRRDIAEKSGPALLEFIRADIEELRRILFDPHSHQVFMSAMDATRWLNTHLEQWLGETNAADTLAQSAPYNVTSEMGLALLDVADAIRPHPEVVAFLEHVQDESFLDELPKLEGGQEARGAIVSYLDTYGMRGVGEIDITRPRWSERPTTLLPLLLGNVKNAEPGAGKRRFEAGRREALDKEQDLLTRLRQLPDGDVKAKETKWRIDRLRAFIGYREYPKYGMVSRYFVYKRALLQEAERLMQAHVLSDRQDIFYLTFPELQGVVRTQHADDELIARRRDAFASYQTLTPPRVFTSDGEVVTGTYRREDLPAGALIGLPVSGGMVEGRARVVSDLADADVEPGDILVTAYTDPSWSPLFVAVSGLVTEVGGLMTHGAVIAREYGLPAVVSVENATRLIEDGQRIRLDGTRGTVEILLDT